ncbi:MAG: PAS domain-containing protein, partial [Novosphingobium sp.]
QRFHCAHVCTGVGRAASCHGGDLLKGCLSESVNFAPLREKVEDPDLATLYAYWVRRCGSRSMPCRADINPKDIVSVIPLALSQTYADRFDFGFAWWGRPSAVAGTKI